MVSVNAIQSKFPMNVLTRIDPCRDHLGCLLPLRIGAGTPTAIIAGIDNATKYGILIREGDALERLPDAGWMPLWRENVCWRQCRRSACS